MPRTPLQVCIHECSHAVVAHLVGARVLKVSAITDYSRGERRAGHCQIADCSPLQLIAVAYAGELGEAKYNGTGRGSVGKDTDDYQQARQQAELMEGDPQKWLQRGEKLARGYLEAPGVMRAIEALAHELVWKQELSGEDMDRIVNQHLYHQE